MGKPFSTRTKKQYNPEVEGYGSAADWRDAFRAAMGLDEARERVGQRSPREILGVGLGATWGEIKRRFRVLATSGAHPDKGGNEEAFKDITAAFEMLKDEFGQRVVQEMC